MKHKKYRQTLSCIITANIGASSHPKLANCHRVVTKLMMAMMTGMPGVTCTESSSLPSFLPKCCLFLLKVSPHPTSEPKGRLLLLLKKTFTDFLRKSKRQSEYRLVQRQSLTVITTDAESDLLTVAQFAQFAQLCLCSFGTTRTFLICQPPGLIAKCGKCAVSATSQASTMPPFSLGEVHSEIQFLFTLPEK